MKKLRELLGDMSQQEFATRLGVSIVSISRWENERRPMTLTLRQFKNLLKLMDEAGMSINELPDE